MKKVELIRAIATKSGYKQKDIATVVDAAVEAITEALVAGEEIRITDIGTLATKERAARVCRNPQTGESVDVPASKALKFKAAKALKDAVNA